MVFLRLEVRVYPREQEQVPSWSGSLRSILPNKKPDSEDTNMIKSFAGLLLTVEKPEELSLADLATLIKQKWKALRPNSEPLVIKKLLDDTMPLIDLDAGMSVEEVFVNRGKARADGHDQRGTVRVIQKPHAHAPERFPSVELDFEAASEAFTRKRKHQTPENDAPSKEPRIEGQFGRVAPQSPKSHTSTRRQELGPSWTSPHRRPSNVLPPNGKGLGLGITSSPPKRPGYDRHVSFSDTSTPIAKNPPKPSIPRSSQGSAPSSSQIEGIVYPPNFKPEKIQQLKSDLENEEREMPEIVQKLKDPNTHVSLLPILRDMLDLHEKIKTPATSKSNRRRSMMKSEHRKKLEEKRMELHKREAALAAESPQPLEGNGHATSEIEESVEVSDIPDSDDEVTRGINGNNDLEKPEDQSDEQAIDIDEEMADAASVKINGQLQTANEKGELSEESESSEDSDSTDESEPEADHSVKSPLDEGAAIVDDSDDEPELPTNHQAKASVDNKSGNDSDDDDDDEESVSTKRQQVQTLVDDEAGSDGDSEDNDELESTTENLAKAFVDDEADVDDDGEEHEEEDEEEEEEEEEDKDNGEDEGSDEESSDSQEDDNESEPEQESALDHKSGATIKDKDETGKIGHTNGTETVEVKATAGPAKLPERNKVQQPVQDSSSSSEDSESEDELDLSKFGRPSIPGPSAATAKPIEQPLPEKTTPRVTPRRTLKGLLKDQKDQQARRAQQPPIQHKVIKPAPTPKKSSIYSVSDSESESSNSDGPGGDILANGQSGKLRQPWSR
ncbi:hypothetical protein N7513_008679 [Penicillium frequentans]|nr:hypothetical protein N7513_008679 [Penicillium glabrum]